MTALSARQLVEQLPANDSCAVPSKQVFCNPGMPPNWLARPWTVISDCGWIVGKPRRSMTPSRPASSFSRRSTRPFARMMAADSPPVGMP